MFFSVAKRSQLEHQLQQIGVYKHNSLPLDRNKQLEFNYNKKEYICLFACLHVR